MRVPWVCWIIFLLVISSSPTLANETTDFNFTLDMKLTIWPENDLIANYIKSSLVPLGINVEIHPVAEWRGQLGREDDLTLTTLTAGLTPVPREQYWGADNDFVQRNFHINNPDFLAHQLEETGMTYQDIKNAELDYLAAANKTESIRHYRDFVELFMEKLLYMVPLTQINEMFLSYSNSLEHYEEGLGIFGSIYRGMRIEDNSGRAHNTSTLVIPTDMTFDRRFSVIGQYPILDGAMFFYDSAGNPHPYHVKQVHKEDWNKPDGTVVPNGKLILDFYRNISMYYGGVGSQPPEGWEVYDVGPRDYLTAFQILKYHRLVRFNDTVPLLDDLEFKVDDENYALEIYSDTPYLSIMHEMNKVFFLPHRYLNTTLTYRFDPSITGTPQELFEMGLSPLYTMEILQIIQSGGVYAGSYRYTNSSYPYESFKFVEDFHFPNEWDTDDFLTYTPKIEEPYYFTYNSTSENPEQKPTKVFFPIIQHEFLPPENQFPFNGHQTLSHYKMDMLKNNSIDYAYFRPDHFISDMDTFITFMEHPEISSYVYKSRDVSGHTLTFDMLNPHLQKLNVRKAIALAIDREALAKALGPFTKLYNVPPPVYSSMEDYYTDDFGIEYDYSSARDLMRSEGYSADDTNYKPRPLFVVSTNFITFERDAIFNGVIVSSSVLLSKFRKRRIKKESGTIT